MDQKKIGLFLKKLRKEKGITQEAFAEELNVSGRTVSRWETGSSLPDISLIVEIADFYDVDVREIIEGERKSEMNEEVKDVANKMTDYAVNEKSRILKWMQMTGFIGVLVTTGTIIFQCLSFRGIPFQKWSLMLSGGALSIMVIITLYVNGLMEKLIQKKALFRAVKIVTVALLVISVYFVTSIVSVFGIGLMDYALPFTTTQGAEKYNKGKLVEKYSDDFDSGFFVFPDSVDHSLSTTYEAKLKTGLFDSDGYIVLDTVYHETDFNAELQRLAGITCEITYEGETVRKKIGYDEDMYRYPAYIASDGFDYNYEYALIDHEKNRIIYIHLSYPDYGKLQEFRDYLKINSKEYELENDAVLDRDTIYAHKFEGLDGWIEYSDMK